MKTEACDLIVSAGKAGVAPPPVVDAFNELSALRAELNKLGAPASYYRKAMHHRPPHHAFFAASNLSGAN